MTLRYDFHGVRLDVWTDDEGVADAIAERFADFATTDARPAEIDFTIELVDDPGAHTVSRPRGRSRAVYDPPEGEVSYFDDTEILYIGVPETLRLECDTRRQTVHVSALRTQKQRDWFLSRPMLTIPLVELLKRRRLFNVHAACLGANGRGVLFAGASGSGKSTIALALLTSGFDFLGDDMVFLRNGNGDQRALAFPDAIDFTPSTAAFFPKLREVAAQPVSADWPKHRLSAGTVFGTPFVADCAPVAIVFPHVSGRPRSELVPVGPDEALLELAPNVLLTAPDHAQAHLDALAELVRVCDCYRLDAGRDFDRITELSRDLVS
jgi:hypothetical protein